MQLRGEQLVAHLERELQPIYAVYGDEPLLVIEAADAIRAAARAQGFAERVVLTAIAGFDWNELHHAAGSMSLFGARQLLDLRTPLSLTPEDCRLIGQIVRVAAAAAADHPASEPSKDTP